MYRSDLRTYGLSAVLTVLLGAGMGFGWNYFVDRAGERAGASAANSTGPKRCAQSSIAEPGSATRGSGP
jgi:predicted negative regulator of RcsB-dependent stress response